MFRLDEIRKERKSDFAPFSVAPAPVIEFPKQLILLHNPFAYGWSWKEKGEREREREREERREKREERREKKEEREEETEKKNEQKKQGGIKSGKTGEGKGKKNFLELKILLEALSRGNHDHDIH